MKPTARAKAILTEALAQLKSDTTEAWASEHDSNHRDVLWVKVQLIEDVSEYVERECDRIDGAAEPE